MNEGTLGLLILVAVSIFSALILHWSISRYLRASFISALLSSAIFQVTGFIISENHDPFILIAFVTGSVVAFGIAIVAGIPFLIARRKVN
jgi:hypothetical protein